MFLRFILCLWIWDPVQVPFNQTIDFAQSRSTRIRDVQMEIYLDLLQESSFSGWANIRFVLIDKSKDLPLDFSGETLLALEVNQAGVAIKRQEGQIILPKEALREGVNQVNLAFEGRFGRKGVGLHRYHDPLDGKDYVYTNLQPRYANVIFPCFDQPDLKVRFSLKARVQDSWRAISNTKALEILNEGATRLYQFETSKPLPTYLFHLSAGPYAVKRVAGSVPMAIYCRDSQADQLQSRFFFKTIKRSMLFFEDWFDEPYPFEKYDVVFVPEINSGGMENPGAVVLNERYLKASEARDLVIFHETAHMWFGNLVTMRWWNDLWLNEAFAEYAAYMCAESLGYPNIWFTANQEKARAVNADSKPGSHPIRSQASDILSATSSFDVITYHKGLAALRQLDIYLGENKFRNGIRRYLDRYAWENITLYDLLNILERESGKELSKWAQQWLTTTGLNTVTLDYEIKDARIKDPVLIQQGTPLRTHCINIGLFMMLPNGKIELMESIPVTLQQERKPLRKLEDRSNILFALPDVDDKSYLWVRPNQVTREAMNRHLNQVRDPFLRNRLANLIWDSLLRAEENPARHWQTLLKLAEMEKNPDMLRVYTERLTIIYDHFTPAQHQAALSKQVLAMTGRRLANAQAPLKQVWQDLHLFSLSRIGKVDEMLALFEQSLQQKQYARCWKILAELAALGSPQSEDKLNALMAQDRSQPERAYKIRALKPDETSKRKSWDFIINLGGSYAQLKATAEGLYHPTQRKLSEPYVATFFELLPKMAAERDPVFVIGYVSLMFPHLGGEEVVRKGEAILALSVINDTVKAMLREEIETVKQRLKVRAQWQ